MQKIKIKKLVLFLLIFFLSACDNDDLSGELDILKKDIGEIQNINSLLLLKNLLLEAKIAEEPIINFNTNEGVITGFELENQGQIEALNDLIIDYEIDFDGWNTSIVFNDSTTFNTFYLGNDEGVSITLDLDPFNSTPLAAIAVIETPISGSIEMRVLGQDGEFSDMINYSSKVSESHEFDLLGLYADFENSVEFKLMSSQGKERMTIVRKITTDPLPEGLPEFEIVKQYETDEQNVVFLINFRPTGIPFMIDRFGKIRWYSTGFTKGGKYALQRFENGNMGFGKSGIGQGSVFEYTISGQLVKEYSFYPEFEDAHHDVFEMNNGNFLIPVNKVGEPTIEDYIIEIDRNSGMTTNVWDLNQILPKRDTLINDAVDWVHVNAVIHDERDNSIIVSGQRQGLFKVTWDNQLKWILAPPFDWAGYEEYLLDSTDPNMDWNWGQHSPLITPEGNLLFFDNGFGRNFGTSEKFSRAMEVSIVEGIIGGSVETVWEFGRERGEEFYSPIISDVDYVEDSNTRLITAGSLAFSHEYTDHDNITNSWSDDFLRSSIIEVNENNNILFELHVNSEITNASIYRAEKVKLY